MEKQFKGDFTVTDLKLVLKVVDCPYPKEWTIYKVENDTYFVHTYNIPNTYVDKGIRYITGSMQYRGTIVQDGDMVKLQIGVLCIE